MDSSSFKTPRHIPYSLVVMVQVWLRMCFLVGIRELIAVPVLGAGAGTSIVLSVGERAVAMCEQLARFMSLPLGAAGAQEDAGFKHHPQPGARVSMVTGPRGEPHLVVALSGHAETVAGNWSGAMVLSSSVPRGGV